MFPVPAAEAPADVVAAGLALPDVDAPFPLDELVELLPTPPNAFANPVATWLSVAAVLEVEVDAAALDCPDEPEEPEEPDPLPPLPPLEPPPLDCEPTVVV